MSRVHVKPGDLVAGQPLKWELFDGEGRTLLAKGAIVGSEEEKTRLLRRRATRELDVQRPDAAASGGPGPQPAEETSREVRVLLDETRIQPGEAMQIQSSLDSTRFSVRLIGYLKNRSIIVTNPVEEGGAVYLKEGQAFVARVFSGKFVFAFPCTVLASPVKPYPHVHLSYPGDVLGVNVRKAERVRVRAIAAFESPGGERGSGIVVDMSCGGAFLVSRSSAIQLGMDTQIHFKLTVSGLEYLMTLRGHVKSIRANDSDAMEGGMGYGVQFHDVSHEDNLVLASFVFQQLAENRTA